MARFHATQDGNIPFTQAEEDARDAQEAQFIAEQPMKDWLGAMLASDAILPRWGEDLMDNMDLTNVPQQTIDKLTAKKALRATKPQ